MDDILCEDLGSDFKSLKLEFRSNIKQKWPLFEPLKISLRMVEFNKQLNQFNDSIIIQVEEDGKSVDLREIFAQTSNSENNAADSVHVKIFFQKNGIAMPLSDDKQTIMRECKIKEGDTLHIEICDENTTHLEIVKDSLLLKNLMKC